MMDSPEVFADECREKSYRQLLAIRDELIKEIYEFEKTGVSSPEDISVIAPSPETVYRCNLEYLAKICELISEKY